MSTTLPAAVLLGTLLRHYREHGIRASRSYVSHLLRRAGYAPATRLAEYEAGDVLPEPATLRRLLDVLDVPEGNRKVAFRWLREAERERGQWAGEAA